MHSRSSSSYAISPVRLARSWGRRRRSPMAQTGANISAITRKTAAAMSSSISICLWSHPAVDAIGIDNYMPLSDWRDEDMSGGNPDAFAGPYDPDGLRRAVQGGEGFDWYYPSETARNNRQRASITDGAHGKPWVFRYKDIAGWWSNLHHNRIGGQEAAQPTAWIPRSKPVWFTEIGCPAVDKGPNQPNVFPDPKSAESASPYFSNGGRSDLAVERYLAAHSEFWDPASPHFVASGNPLSPLYGGRMVDPSRLYVWAWDARPFPAFPLTSGVWRDGRKLAAWPLAEWEAERSHLRRSHQCGACRPWAAGRRRVER